MRLITQLAIILVRQESMKTELWSKRNIKKDKAYECLYRKDLSPPLRRNVKSPPTPSITSLSPYVSPTEYPLNTNTYGLMRVKK